MRNETREEAIVEEKDGEGEDEIVEEGVVGAENHANLPDCDDEEANDANATREEQHPDQEKLKSESAKRGGSVEPGREMLEIPADPSRERTVLVILVHGGEMAPLGIATGDFGNAGLKVDAEPFPEKKKDSGVNGRTVRSEAGTKSGRGQEKRDEAGFEKHTVGLVAGELGRGTDEGEKADEAEEEHGAREDVDGEEDGGEEAGPGDGR